MARGHLQNRESIKMAQQKLSKFIEGLEEQFTSLGLNLVKEEGEFEWNYLQDGEIRAVLEGVMITGSAVYSSILKWQVHHIEKVETDEDGNKDATGVYYGDFDNVENALLKLIKVITEVRREVLDN